MRYAGENCCGRDIIWDGEGGTELGMPLWAICARPNDVDVDDKHTIF